MRFQWRHASAARLRCRTPAVVPAAAEHFDISASSAVKWLQR
jgi:hypothetical protein